MSNLESIAFLIAELSMFKQTDMAQYSLLLILNKNIYFERFATSFSACYTHLYKVRRPFFVNFRCWKDQIIYISISI